jgi:hypothetical protein
METDEVAEMMSRIEEQLGQMPDKNQITLDDVINESIEENEHKNEEKEG